MGSIARIRGDLETAFLEARKEIRVYQQDIGANLLMAELDLAGGNAFDAAQQFLHLLRSGVDIRMIIGSWTKALILMGKVEVARKQIDISEEMFGTSPELHFARALVEMSDCRFDIARETLQKTGYLKDMRAMQTFEFHLAFLENNSDTAQRLLDRMTAEGERTPDVIAAEGLLSLMRGDLPSARERFEEARQLAPYDGDYRIVLATIDIVEEKTDKARMELEALKKEAPTLMSVYEMEGHLLLREGKPQEALSLMEKVLAVHPRNTIALFTKGAALVALDRPFEAIETGEKLIEMCPKSSDGYLVLSRAFLALGDLQLAEEFAHKACARTEIDHGLWPLVSPTAILEEIEAARKTAAE